MNNHKLLYKEQGSFTSSQRSRLNRELIAARRIEQRRYGYQESRNVSSPIRNKKESIVSINCSEDKENVTNIITDENTNTARLAKIVCNATNPEKLTKQESFVKRFLEWKEKNNMKKEINKKKPFLSAVSNKTQTSTYNFVPSGHKGFRPPEGLKKPVDQKDEKTEPAVVKGRQSIYSIVPTPPRRVEKCANKFPIAKKVSSTKPATVNKSKTKTQAVCKEQPTIKSTTSTAKSSASTLESNKKTNKTENFAPTDKKKTIIKTTTISTAKSAASTSENKNAKKTENFAQPAVTSTNRQTGAVAKVRRVAQKRAETDKQNKNSPLKKSGAGLAQNLKAKKLNSIKNGNAPSLQINGKRLKNLINYNKLDDDMVIKTPKDLFTLNPTANKSKTKTQAVCKKQTIIKTTTISTAKSAASTSENNKANKTENLAQPAITSTNRQAGAVAKLRRVAQKRAETDKQNKNSPLKKSGAGLAQNLKAKKLNTIKNGNAPSLQINCDMVIQTPKDFFTLNPFKELVTSTRIKSSTDNSKNVEEISPIETSCERFHSNSSSKRNIFQETNTTLRKECDYKPQEKTKEDGLKNISKKFNFIRYSNTADVTDIDQKDKEEKQGGGEEEINNLSDNGNKTVHVVEATETTPVKSGPEERPVNYLSPYVSVARGKVSLKKEEQKRKSVYLQNAAESIDVPTSTKYSVEVRRTIDGVRYFRKQLQDEIDRLHKLCDVWEAYKTDNLETIQNANGEDMINVTIGQTRLLTSKKFMQFKSLIDRCEAGATGIGMVAYDGSENTKPITLVDLEGFWSMLGLQVDNLDKRFDNLNRWKLNDWKDPDEVDIKIKKNLTKVKKPKTTVSKAKPSLALQSMLRKMQAEMRKNKNSINEEVQTQTKLKRRSSNSNKATPRKSVDTSTTRRLSTVVKDRKYFSPVPTVTSVSYTNSKPSRKQRKSLQDSQKLVNHIEEFNEDRMQSSLDLRKSILINDKSKLVSLNSPSSETDKNSSDCTTVNNKKNELSVSNYTYSSSSQSSILKTPGTARSKQRNVIFNEKVRAKTNEDGTPFNDENSEDANQTHEEDLAKSCEEELESTDASQRTLTLRNRRVRLRPSCEIVIPKK